MDGFAQVSRSAVDQETSVRAHRAWWDAEAEDYYAEHGAFLGDAAFVWGPEGWTEEELRLLTPDGRMPQGMVLEIGAGAAQCARWLLTHGAVVVASDLSAGMLARARSLDATATTRVPLVQCDGTRLPFGDATFDVVFTAYGVVPFVADSAGLMREVARVLVPGGRFVYATTHPVRWALPDDPSEVGLRVMQSYFDRSPYVESEPDGTVVYVEHHRTIGDRVRECVAAGLEVLDIVEPPWPERNTSVWGGWSPLRGSLLPGTAIFVCRRR